MKRDLAEFTQVVQHDTACTIAATASVVKDKLAVSTGAGGLGSLWERARGGVSRLCLPLGTGSFQHPQCVTLSLLPGADSLLSTVRFPCCVWDFCAVVGRNLWPWLEESSQGLPSLCGLCHCSAIMDCFPSLNPALLLLSQPKAQTSQSPGLPLSFPTKPRLSSSQAC